MRVARFMMWILMALMVAPTFTWAGEKFKTETALTLDASLHGVIASPWRTVDNKFGIGGNLTFELRPWEFLAAGVQCSARQFMGDNSWGIVALDLDGKLFPFGRREKGEFYLDGGVGIMMPEDNDIDANGKRVHGFAGAGYRFFIKSSQSRFLNLGVIYDCYSPSKTPLSVLGVKVGLGWNFGSNRPNPKKNVAQPKVKASTVVAEPSSSEDTTVDDSKSRRTVKASGSGHIMDGPETDVDVSTLKGHRVMLYNVQKGECLWSISGKEEIYDDGTKWPRIYKANRDQIKDPNLIYPKQKLKVVDPNQPLGDKVN